MNALMRVQWRRMTVAITAAAGPAMFLGINAGVAHAAPRAHAARTLNVSETARLRLISKSGAVLNERGFASGTLPGTVSAQFKVTVVIITGSVTIYPHDGGSLKIQVVGFPRSAGTNAKFGGTISVIGGTGRYRHAHGTGSFSGTLNRRTSAATVTAHGHLTL